jgi:hypothetical protein
MYKRQQTSWFAEHKGTLAASAVFLAALGFGGWGAWQVFWPGSGDPRAQITSLKRDNADLKDEAEQLRQRVATLTRSDQISRDANRDLQGTLSERDEEIAGLRADVAFYERLVGSTGQRRGLNTHEVLFAPEDAGTWHYTITLTQNLNRGAISKGTMRFAVEGVRAGKLASIKWDELLQKPGAPGQPFSFRYFQQLEGSVMLPAGFTPQRVRVQLNGGGDQVFDWIAKKSQGE